MTEIFKDISPELSGLTRAIKLQQHAAQVGFDWTSITPVIEKVEEELEEIREALAHAGDHRKLQGEIGDLLFACINLARHTRVDPEMALRNCNDKFEQRFHYIESALSKRGSSPAKASLEEMDALWEEAKAKEVETAKEMMLASSRKSEEFKS